jgi:hypothetical protein
VAVHLDQARRVRARLEVQTVHVLRDQRDELAPALELDEGTVAGIGLDDLVDVRDA